MSKCLAAFTKPGSDYPGFINITEQDDGSVTITVRGKSKEVNGSYICGYDRDKGKSGRCVPGDENCNNYCNLAPQKGPMQHHPKPCKLMIEGPTASITLTEAEYDEFTKVDSDAS